ncbi:MAG: hypothetical protein ACR2P9_03715 [Gammaproteobacteria bacterium]
MVRSQIGFTHGKTQQTPQPQTRSRLGNAPSPEQTAAGRISPAATFPPPMARSPANRSTTTNDRRQLLARLLRRVCLGRQPIHP